MAKEQLLEPKQTRKRRYCGGPSFPKGGEGGGKKLADNS